MDKTNVAAEWDKLDLAVRVSAMPWVNRSAQNRNYRESRYFLGQSSDEESFRVSGTILRGVLKKRQKSVTVTTKARPPLAIVWWRE